MKHYDWIVVGAGITGAALSYELTKAGFAVLLLDRTLDPQAATRFSYGGVAYWSGTTELTQQLCAEGRERYRSLFDELDADLQFRELDLVLTIAPTADPQAIAQTYAHCAIPPRLLTVAEACNLEPLLNPRAIAGALTVKHGHIEAEATTQAYIQAMLRLGGTWQVGDVTAVYRDGLRVVGVGCGETIYRGDRTAICTGAFSRPLLKAAGVPVRLYFTHAEILETPPVDLRLRSLVMPAELQRFPLEARFTTSELDPLWDEPGQDLDATILDVGAIQFLDGRIRIGQMSRILTDPAASSDSVASEAMLRTGVGEILPALAELPATWHHCLISFSCDKLPLVGELPGTEGLYLFAGFSNPLAIVPPLAQRFASKVAGKPDALLDALSPGRFCQP